MPDGQVSAGPLEAEFATLCAAARDVLGINLEGYRSRQLARRLEFFRQKHGLRSDGELALRLRTDTGLRQQFADYVTINVSEFFRNPERWWELRDRHLPSLLQARSALRVWSAGCSIGAEIYTVALLLRQMAPGRRHRLLATDIDAASLVRAREATYQPHEIRAVPVAVQERFFQQTAAGWKLAPAISSQVEFSRLDLLKDPFPEDLDLILCRNVVIYFTDTAKAELYRRLVASLRPGGLMFIGATESIFAARSIGLRYLGSCFYQKVDQD